MSEYPLWRYILMLAVMTTNIRYALPNVFGCDPALQISV